MFPKCLEICVGVINIINIKSYIICLFQLCRPPYNGTTNDQWKCDDDLFCLFNFRRNHHRKRRWSHHGLEGRQGLKSLERNAPGTNMIMIKPKTTVKLPIFFMLLFFPGTGATLIILFFI